MSIHRLDNEYSAFLAAQESFRADPEAKATLEVTSNSRLVDFVDAMRLQGLLDRYAEMRFEKAYRQYLEELGGFDKAFLDHLEQGIPPITRVLTKNGKFKVSVKGLRADLPLWEVPVQTQLRHLYYDGVAEVQSLDLDALVGEGGRRFQVKGDMIRNSELRFVEAGTRYRTNFQWHSLLFQVMVGDMGDRLIGTTNMAMALAFGLTPVANVEARRVHAPSVKELEAVLDGEGRPVVVVGANAFQMAHLYGHFGDLITFEWDQDLTGDMGPAGTFLPLEVRTIPKKG